MSTQTAPDVRRRDGAARQGGGERHRRGAHPAGRGHVEAAEDAHQEEGGARGGKLVNSVTKWEQG